MHWLSLTVIGLLLARLLAQLGLEALNRAEVRRRAGALPPALTGVMDAATFAKAGDYTLAKSRFASGEMIFEAAVLAAVVFSGLLPWLWARVDGLAPGAAWSGALFLVVTMILLGLPSLPLAWWAQFRLEARFGFNQSTLGLWVSDQVKSTVLGLLIGFPLAWALLALVGRAGPLWWVWGFGLLFGFQLLMLVLYPKLILPLFNKLTPLPEGDARTRLLALSDRTGFKAQTIEVMDGSKRSAHSNAFFTGFGRFRRIVLFDTLMTQLTQEELEAVLAHEIGHYRRGHIPQRLVTLGLLQLGGFAVIAWLAQAPWFNPAFGLPAGATAATFLLFGLLGGLITFWFSPLGNRVSQKHEYEADAFARDAMGGAAPLSGALRKLSQKNLSNLTPHPLYSAVYYSHPTLVERERALQG
ncbi:Protease HtpX [Lacunisphaera limnophila]|uniref:Protease HtpX n=1 Tax=Lacunisphaera limnophila TaxID=1838286 RepID=A0A1D8AY25_9BACT|nr:M48 family metallopeptidase [Lacunisphaera limnophila]AOS45764.1 Protease HtpX [Lacunisphaera limnophila]